MGKRGSKGQRVQGSGREGSAREGGSREGMGWEGRKGYTLSPGLLSPMGGRVVLHVGSCMVVLCCFNPFRVMRS